MNREDSVVTSNIEPILIITGLLTAAMIVQFLAPSWTVRHTFGATLSSETDMVLARHWGLLLFCVGMLLFFSAFHPELRKPATVLASIEKVGFVACVFGTSLRHRRIVSLMAAGDAAMTLIFVLYLFGL
jgi:hypothetical protein